MITAGDTTLRLTAGGSLEGVAEANLASALAELTYSPGLELELRRDPPPGCGDDHVTAINLTRPIEPVDESAVEEARNAAVAKYAGASEVEVVHYIGGPCNPEEISCCVVTGGTHGAGWTVVQELQQVIELAPSAPRARPNPRLTA